MSYISTRGNIDKVNAAEAIRLGMVPKGGLFVPDEFPNVTIQELENLKGKSYQILSKKILSLFLNDFTEKEIEQCIALAYNSFNFENDETTPLVKLNERTYVMELWHGPTAAFKDMALQIMPHLLVKSKEITKVDKETVILVATSGDTGKAALEGFKDVEGIKIIVFYPEDGVSEVQKLQMNTTDGKNTYVIAVKGNFDDCQTGVKDIFSDFEYRKGIEQNNIEFSSANSINWGRLLPQIIYYFKAYISLLEKNAIKLGEEINFCVPTGNFGNILAGYYAKKMGLPIGKLICASNENKVLTDFFVTGKYDRNREFHKTMSPSMDILISSNLERFLFDITGKDADKINSWYKDLNEKGLFEVDTDTFNKMKEIIVVGYTNEIETKKTIKNIKDTYNYVADTHTAVALKVDNDMKNTIQGITVVDSTASPYKFSTSVINALEENNIDDEFYAVEKVAEISKTKVHRAVKGLKEKKVLHKKVISKEDMKDIIKEILK